MTDIIKMKDIRGYLTKEKERGMISLLDFFAISNNEYVFIFRNYDSHTINLIQVVDGDFSEIKGSSDIFSNLLFREEELKLKTPEEFKPNLTIDDLDIYSFDFLCLGNICKKVSINREMNLKKLEGKFVGNTLNSSYESIASFDNKNQYSLKYAFIKAIEETKGIEPSDKEKIIRMIILELARVSSHLFYIDNLFLELKYYINQRPLKALNQKLLNLIDEIDNPDLNLDILFWIPKAKELLKDISKFYRDINDSVTKNRVFFERTQTGYISKENAISFAITGANLRAIGINYDLRKRTPYYFYDKLDFEIPIGINGKIFDRYLVRLEEIYQSVKIIEQLINNIPDGKRIINLDDASFVGPISYSSIEAPNGELGFLITNKSQKMNTLNIRTPSYSYLQIYQLLIENELVTDISLIYKSLDINMRELSL